MAANSAALHRYQQRNIFLMVDGERWKISLIKKKNTKQGGGKLIGMDQAWDIVKVLRSESKSLCFFFSSSSTSTSSSPSEKGWTVSKISKIQGSGLAAAELLFFWEIQIWIDSGCYIKIQVRYKKK